MAEELATLAEDVAAAAERAAQTARHARRRAVEIAGRVREEFDAADQSVTEARVAEADAAAQYGGVDDSDRRDGP